MYICLCVCLKATSVPGNGHSGCLSWGPWLVCGSSVQWNPEVSRELKPLHHNQSQPTTNQNQSKHITTSPMNLLIHLSDSFTAIDQHTSKTKLKFKHTYKVHVQTYINKVC